MLKIKPGVKLQGLQPEMLIAVVVCRDICGHFGVDAVITSARDGIHGKGSRHRIGMAIDLRIRDLKTDQPQDVTRKIGEALGEEFDVVLEMEKHHIHIEFDPDE